MHIKIKGKEYEREYMINIKLNLEFIRSHLSQSNLEGRIL